MLESADSVLYKFRFYVVAILVFGNMFLVSLLLPGTGSANTGSSQPVAAPVAAAEPHADEQIGFVSDDANVVTAGMGRALNEIEQSVDNLEMKVTAAGNALSGGMAAVGHAGAQSGRLLGSAVSGTGRFAASSITDSGRLAASVVQGVFSFAAQGIRNGVAVAARVVHGTNALLLNTIGGLLGLISNAPVVSSVIKPVDSADTPAIKAGTPMLAALAAEQPAGKPQAQAAAHADDPPIWPVRGEITTYFGVPHWPYQRTHSGMDISDGTAPGTTPITPFKPGVVVATVRSFYGLGNHVIVDHGNGLTSVYAHMMEIFVQEGQTVDKNTVLGTQGSTGASTGTHLHFEIRVNGQPVDPRQYVQGLP